MKSLVLVWLLLSGAALAEEPVRVTVVSEPLEARIYDQQAQFLGLTGHEIQIDFSRYGNSPLRLSLTKPDYQSLPPQEVRKEQLESGRYPEQGAIPLIPLKRSAPLWPWLLLAPALGLVGWLLRKRRTPVEASPSVALPSLKQLDSYSLEELLGQGGMGRVYRASKGEGAVALKVLQAPEAEEMREEFVQRWQRESHITANLNHRGIVRVLDYGSQGTEYYIVMELLEGRTLGGLLSGGAMPVAEVKPLLRQLTLAMGYAHRQGVVHRDLKPENIMLTGDRQLKVMDFGLARAETSANLTQSGQALGTVAYMAPEQFLGSSRPESDQYAIGLITYQMLTGRLPYDETQDAHQTMMWHLQAPVSPPSFFNSRLPQAIDAVLLRMLDKVPERRYPSLEAAWVALEGALGGA